MAKYISAPGEIIELAQDLIDDHYVELQDAGIGFLGRADLPISGGRVVFGGVKKVGAVEREFLDYDFIVWVTLEPFYGMTSTQQAACIDHLLCHCVFNPDTGKAGLEKPDIMEFTPILRRYGLWRPDANDAREALLQMPMFESRGKVEAVHLSGMTCLISWGIWILTRYHFIIGDAWVDSIETDNEADITQRRQELAEKHGAEVSAVVVADHNSVAYKKGAAQ